MSSNIPGPRELTASVVVITLSRPTFVRTCLKHLAAQTVPPFETVVVDASPDDLTYTLVSEEYPDVRYIRNPFGPGTMGLSRNMGLREVTGDILAFVDDDAFAEDDWLEQLLIPYADPAVGGVGGQALNGLDGEEQAGLDDIGRFHADGTLSGNFAADPGHIVEVDHVLGANMSFRRRAVLDMGGIQEGYPGTCLREDTDLAFRMRAAGWKLVYNPASTVRHVAAPYSKGRRFDLRYNYFAHRNHIVLLARHQGYRSPQLRRYLGVSGRGMGEQFVRAGQELVTPGHAPGRRAKRSMGCALRAMAMGAGSVVGMGAGVVQRRADRRRIGTTEIWGRSVDAVPTP
jgi:GT2 family glycosyltransferase